MNASTTNLWIADTALTPTGWAHDVSLGVSPDGVFTSIEPAESRGATPPDSAVRLHGVVLPALSNLHSHAFQRGLVGRMEHRTVATVGDPPDDFWSWRRAMYAFLERLDPDSIEEIATLVYSEMLRAGYGSVAEFHYLHHSNDGRPYDDPFELSRRLIRAARRAGIRLTLVPVVYESAGFGGVPLADAQQRFALSADDVTRMVDALGDEAGLSAPESAPRVAFGVGLHSLRAATPNAVAAIADWAADHPNVPVHLHIAEQPAEVESCLVWSGTRPVQWLLDHAPVDSRWCLVHATHIDETEWVRVAASGAVVALCPTTEANLGDGIFPLSGYEEAGGRWGVGSDSQVSTSPSDEMKTLEYGQRLALGTRLVAGRASAPLRSTGRALVEACFESAARALDQPVGRLEAGAAADMVVLDPEHPRLLGLEGDAILDAWIFGSGSEAVRDVMVGGQWVVRDGVHLRWGDAVAGYRKAITRLTAS